MKHVHGIQISPTSWFPISHGSVAVAATPTALARMRVPSIRAATVVMPTAGTRGVGFLWQDNVRNIINDNKISRKS